MSFKKNLNNSDAFMRVGDLNNPIDDYEISQAINCLSGGGIVGFPTETVFGLGADASNVKAVRSVYEAKSRPKKHPLILHLSGVDQIDDWVVDAPPSLIILADKFWPGPLTIILKAKPRVADHFSGNMDTVAIRLPSHPVAKLLLEGLGRGIVAPSANRFGRLSATSSDHVFEELGQKVDFIIKADSCPIGLESTIVDLSGDTPAILRPGIIGSKAISDALGGVVLRSDNHNPKAPGSHPSHYAPLTPLTVVHCDKLEKFLHQDAQGLSVAVLGTSARPRYSGAAVWQAAPANARDYGKELYALLRRLDHSGCDLIAVEEPLYLPDWLPVHDRLKKSSIPNLALKEFLRNTRSKRLRNG